MQETMISRYNAKTTLESSELKEKVKLTNLEKYGFEHNGFESTHFKEKVEETMIKKYGITNWAYYHIPKDILTNINSQNWWDQFSKLSDVIPLLNDNLSNTTILRYAHKFRPDFDFKSSISLPHQMLVDFINQYQIEYIVNDRDKIKPLELDIYIPSKSLAIEVNGLYWHSELAGGKDKNYHLNKTLECEKQGIQLLQFWDIEILNKINLVQSMISYHLMQQNIKKIHGRKCNIINLETCDAKDFLNENHIQGFEKGSIKKGLLYQNELVACLIADKPRFTKSFDLEIIRFCSKQNTQVQGGFSKLTKSLGFKSLISYANRKYSKGNVYESSGWHCSHYSKPSYHYTNDYASLINRTSYQKHKLSNLLEIFDPSLTEWENMKLNGFDRIWDCGNSVWIKNSNNVSIKLN